MADQQAPRRSPSSKPRGAAILLPGAGSSEDFVRRVFAGVALDREVRVVTRPAGDARGLVDSIESAISDLTGRGWRTEVVAGVSLGAHAAAQWAARSRIRDLDLLLVMPAWTGSPGAIAAATAAAADRLEAVGVAEELARIRTESPGDWVVAELTRAWPQWSEQALISALRATARSPAPTVEELAQICARTGIVGLRSDPLHPHSTASGWHAAIPGAGLVLIDRSAPAGDVAVLGAAAALAARSTHRHEAPSGSR